MTWKVQRHEEYNTNENLSDTQDNNDFQTEIFELVMLWPHSAYWEKLYNEWAQQNSKQIDSKPFYLHRQDFKSS